MASYNDLSFNSGEYIKQYAGIPLDQIQHTADTLSTRHYQNLGSASQLQILANQLKAKALPGAKAYYDKHIEAIGQTIDDMAKNGGENSTAKINALATAFQGDQGMLNSQLRSEEYNKQTEAMNKQLAAGFTPVYNRQAREDLANASPNSLLYSTPYQGAVEPERNHFAEQKAIFDEIQPDMIEGTLHNAFLNLTPAQKQAMMDPNNPDRPVIMESITRGGISSKRIQEMLTPAWITYKNTPSYKQQIGILNKPEEQVKREFEANAMLNVFDRVSRQFQHVPGTGTGPINDQQVGGNYTGAYTTQSPFNFDPDDINANGIIEKGWLGKLMSIPIPSAVTTSVPAGPVQTIGNNDLMAQQTPSDKTKTKEMLKVARIVMSIHGKDKQAGQAGPDTNNIFPTLDKGYSKPVSELSDDEVQGWVKSSPDNIALIKDYMVNIAGQRYNQDFQTYPLTEKQRTYFLNDVVSSPQNRGYVDLQTGKAYSSLKDKSGDVHDALTPLMIALETGNAHFVGMSVAKNNLRERHKSEGNADLGENFTMPYTINAVDPKTGAVHEYLVGSRPLKTEPDAVNINGLYRKTSKLPGGWVDIGHKMQFLEPLGAQTEQMWNEIQGAKREDGTLLTKEDYDANDNVFIKVEGRPKPLLFPNYETAAHWLTANGIKLK